MLSMIFKYEKDAVHHSEVTVERGQTSIHVYTILFNKYEYVKLCLCIYRFMSIEPYSALALFDSSYRIFCV